MPAGHVNRTELEANYQSPGQLYDDTKTEGALEVIADQVDLNYDDKQTHKLAAVLDHPDGSVTNAKIATGVITADKFVAGALENETQNGLRITAHEAGTTVHNTATNLVKTNGVNPMTGPLSFLGVNRAATESIMIDLADGSFSDNKYTIGMGAISAEGMVNYDSGATSTASFGHRFRVNAVEILKILGNNRIKLNNSAELISGSGSPEGAVTAPIGSFYFRTDVGEWYGKKTGAGNTGWGKVTTA